MEIFFALAVVDEEAEAFIIRLVAGGHHAPFTGDHVLGGIEGEAGEMPERARLCILVQGTMGLRRILDELQAVRFADLLQCFDIERLAEEVDPDHGPGFRSDPFLPPAGG